MKDTHTNFKSPSDYYGPTMRLLYYAAILRLRLDCVLQGVAHFCRLDCVLQGVAHFCAPASIENAVCGSISQQENDQTRGDHARMLCFAAFLKGADC